VKVTVEPVVVTSEERARELRMPGSPTIRLDGLDVDPQARGGTSFGFT